jgi:hypothetical protein
VLEVEDLEDGPVDVDVVAVLELVGAYDGRSALSRAKFQCGSAVVWFASCSITIAAKKREDHTREGSGVLDMVLPQCQVDQNDERE